jgi:hypothetical protein
MELQEVRAAGAGPRCARGWGPTGPAGIWDRPAPHLVLRLRAELAEQRVAIEHLAHPDRSVKTRLWVGANRCSGENGGGGRGGCGRRDRGSDAAACRRRRARFAPWAQSWPTDGACPRGIRPLRARGGVRDAVLARARSTGARAPAAGRRPNPGWCPAMAAWHPPPSSLKRGNRITEQQVVATEISPGPRRKERGTAQARKERRRTGKDQSPAASSRQGLASTPTPTPTPPRMK